MITAVLFLKKVNIHAKKKRKKKEVSADNSLTVKLK